VEVEEITRTTKDSDGLQVYSARLTGPNDNVATLPDVTVTFDSSNGGSDVVTPDQGGDPTADTNSVGQTSGGGGCSLGGTPAGRLPWWLIAAMGLLWIARRGTARRAC